MSVNLSPVGGVAQQFFDNNGQPLSGGKIYTYAAGTTTPQTVYTSATGTTPHSNPIILDSAGRVPGGEIWLTNNLQYKFVIYTSLDILIGTYDNIIGINSNFVNFEAQNEFATATAGQTVFTLSTINYQPGTNTLNVFIDGVKQYVGTSYLETNSTTVTFTSGLHVGAQVEFTTAVTLSTGVTDASLVTYTANFTGATAQTVQTKLEQYVSDKDFGAVGDNITNDATAIQAAITSQNALSGGTLGISGRSLVSTALNIVRPVGTTTGGFNVVGIGDGSTLTLPNASFTLFTSTNTEPANPLNETVNFYNLSFVGSNAAAAAYVMSKDFLRTTFVNTRFEKVKAVNSTIYLQSLRFLNCETWRHQGVWLNSGGVLFDCTFDNCRFEAGEEGIQAAGALGIRVLNSLYEGSSGPFLKLDGGNGVLISGNYTEGNATKDYVLTSIAGLGASRGVAFIANAMAVTPAGYNIDVGDVRGMASIGNYCTGDMFNMTNTRIGEFTSIGDHCAGTNKFSNDYFWEATADGLEMLGNALTATPAGGQPTALVLKRPMNLISTAVRSGTANASVAVPPSDEVAYGSVGKYCHIINRATQAIDVFYSQADRSNWGVTTAAIGVIQPDQAMTFFCTGQGSWVPYFTLDATWAQGTGTENKGAFATYTAPTINATYSQAQVQALANGLQAASQRILALENALRSRSYPK